MAPDGEARLAREFTQVPVTALAFHRSPQSGEALVLAGEDTDVRIYEAESGRVVCQLAVFEEQPVQGIDVRESDSWVLVWGSKYVAAFSIKGVEGGVRSRIIRTIAPDWVYNGRLSPYDASVAVLATAHNEVVRLSIDHDSGDITVGEIISPARPILYSAEMAWLDKNCVLMVAGTAFGEILVWKCHLGDKKSSSHEMLFVLTGHEGSIYGVNICPPLTLPDGTSARFLATCSDDRTVRIWDITERAESKRTYDDKELSAARETGFSDILPGEEQPTMGTIAPVAVAMGHLSRIWGVRFAAPEDGSINEGGMSVYSFGEDSTTQRWQFALGGSQSSVQLPLTGKLTNEKAFALHDGKHLWSYAVKSLGKSKTIITGGADSRISLIEEPQSVSTATTQGPDGVLTFEVPSICRSEATQPRSKRAENVGRFQFISQDQLLVISSGRLLSGHFTEEDIQWKQVRVEEDLQGVLGNVYAMERLREGVALFGTTEGGLYVYHSNTERLTHITKLSSKITDITYLKDASQHHTAGSIDILVTLFGAANSVYLTVDPTAGAVISQVNILGLDPRFVAFSAARIGQYLIMGSRHGFISIFTHSDEGYTKILDYDIVNRDAITSLIELPSTPESVSSDSTSTHFLATSRDGRYRIFEIEDNGSIQRLHVRHDATLPFGPMIEGAWLTEDASPELIFYGFRSRYFIIWNETRREERMSVDCGGGHRTISLYHGRLDNDTLRFAFNRASKLSISSQMKPRSRPLKKGTHGREIRALSSNGNYIATGSEDTTIRIWEYQPHKDQPTDAMRCLAVIKMHISGLQTLKWLGEDYLFSSAGHEEFFVWRVKKVDTDVVKLGVQFESAFEDKSRDGDLRIMDFDVSRSSDGGGAHGDIIITMIFSNSAFRTYRYSPTVGFELVTKGAYTGACLTQVCHLAAVGDESTRLLTTSTDGRICLWQSTKDEKGEQVYAISQIIPLHQSSIKCLDMITEGNTYYLLTGGDDNALGLTIIERDTHINDYTVSIRGIVRSAHAAALNSIVASRQTDGNLLAISVSNDQRIKTWSVEPSTADEGSKGTWRIKLRSNTYSGVADPGDIAFLDDQARSVVVTGVGVEVWNLGTNRE